MRNITINADLGESIGIHSFGNDEALLAIVDTVNVACGMHAGDPSEMDRVVRAAVRAGVTVGAHPGLPDLVGFGRRRMHLERDEVRDLVRYQVGALSGFLDAHGAPLDHIKPHGALFSMTAEDPLLMDAVCDVAVQYGVGVFGLGGTAHERVASERGVPFVAELYVDLDYEDDGRLRVLRRAQATDPAAAADRVRAALTRGAVRSASGSELPVRVDSVCVHSDPPNAAEVAEAVSKALAEGLSPRST